MSGNFKKGELVRNKEGEKARILAFTAAKGGQLKTTSAANIAGAIMKDKTIEHAKVCIIDTDAQANIFSTFGLDADMLEKHQDFSAVLIGCEMEDGTKLEAASEQALQHTVFELYQENEDKYIHAISANENCDLIEMRILTKQNEFPNPTTLLAAVCEVLADYYTHIILDTPPAYSLIVANVFMIPNVEIYAPFEPETYALRSAIKTMRTFDFIQEVNPSMRFGGLFATKVKRNTNIHGTSINMARSYTQTTKKRFLKTSIPSSIKAANAVMYDAVPAVLSSKKADYVREYIELWEEIK